MRRRVSTSPRPRLHCTVRSGRPGSRFRGRGAAPRLGGGLREAGLFVSHNQYHKHGAYLLANGDMSGFSRQAQSMLSSLVRGHRRKFPASVFEQFTPAGSGRRFV